jgi:translation initiation factor RLI1
MCPLPDKAIKIQQDVGSGLQKPYVLKEKCIGCGVCEFHCPVGGDAAIQVFSLPDNNHPLSNL